MLRSGPFPIGCQVTDFRGFSASACGLPALAEKGGQIRLADSQAPPDAMHRKAAVADGAAKSRERQAGLLGDGGESQQAHGHRGRRRGSGAGHREAFFGGMGEVVGSGGLGRLVGRQATWGCIARGSSGAERASTANDFGGPGCLAVRAMHAPTEAEPARPVWFICWAKK